MTGSRAIVRDRILATVWADGFRPISLELRRWSWVRRGTWAWSREKLEREELRIIQLGSKHCAVAVRCKSQNITRRRKQAPLGNEKITGSAKCQPSREVEAHRKWGSYAVGSEFEDGVVTRRHGALYRHE
jgi:hypothetical protein